MLSRLILKKIKGFLKKFFLIDDTPHKIAAGAALGVFFGISPGEGIATTLIFASLFRFNRLAATAGVLAVNMWTTILVLPLAAGVGAFISDESYENLANQFRLVNGDYFQLLRSKILFFDITLPLLAGFFIVAGVIALAVYFFLLFLLLRQRRIKKNTHLLTKDK